MEAGMVLLVDPDKLVNLDELAFLDNQQNNSPSFETVFPTSC